MDRIKRMQELIPLLNRANFMYEQGHDEIMSNTEYDKLYDELKILEMEAGCLLDYSPTQKVGCEVVGKLNKVKHNTPMLSLDKTKEVDKLTSWLGSETGLLSYKLDGLTLILEYNKGVLIKAVTRGNGEVGEDVTHNARVMKTIPNAIEYKDKLIIRGEAVISYETFNRINKKLPVDNRYKNPRNLASGSIRQLDSSICKDRNVEFVAFEVLEGFDETSKTMYYHHLEHYGLTTVTSMIVEREHLKQSVDFLTDNIDNYPYPVDGLVLTFDNIPHSNSLPATSKFPRHSIAFKWADESVETTLTDIEWNTSRTGVITPVAIFEPIEIDGTIVGRASLHNISIIERLKLKLGDRVGVVKANMIIPQIVENYDIDNKDREVTIPNVCPTCSDKTEIRQDNASKILYCTNYDCEAKLMGRLKLFCSRDAMNIEGLSDATLSKLVNLGIVESYLDLYTLYKRRDDLVKLDRFGVKSIDKLLTNIESSRNPEMSKFLYSMGISNIGRTASKLLCEHFRCDISAMKNASINELQKIETIGETIALSLHSYLNGSESEDMFALLNKFIKPIKLKPKTSQALSGKVFVVTGKVNHFKNRKELQSKIEDLGGKVTGSVSKNTDFVINNDVESTTGKNKRAKELDIPIITEKDLIALIKTIN